MIPRFGLFTGGALLLLILLGIFHREPPAADPAAALVERLRKQGDVISKPRKTPWDTPGFAVSVADCPKPVEVLMFDFDEILSPGIVPAVQAVESGTLQIDYDGAGFDHFDRGALYRLRLRSAAAGLMHGRLADPPVILVFWPAGCTPKPVL